MNRKRKMRRTGAENCWAYLGIFLVIFLVLVQTLAMVVVSCQLYTLWHQFQEQQSEWKAEKSLLHAQVESLKQINQLYDRLLLQSQNREQQLVAFMREQQMQDSSKERKEIQRNASFYDTIHSILPIAIEVYNLLKGVFHYK